MTTAQKEMMAARRSHIPSFDSGGGNVRAFPASAEATIDPEGSPLGSDAGDASTGLGGAMLRVSAVNFRVLKGTRYSRTHRPGRHTPDIRLALTTAC